MTSTIDDDKQGGENMDENEDKEEVIAEGEGDDEDTEDDDESGRDEGSDVVTSTGRDDVPVVNLVDEES